MKPITISLVLIISLIISSSCKKEEGIGGTAKITGKIKMNVYNEDFSVLQNSYYAKAENVYIVYGEDTNYSNSVKTNYDGTFDFTYLRKGIYKIFVYSEDSLNISPYSDVPVFIDAEILKNGETVDLGEINIFKTIAYNKGTSTITGKVYAYDYNAELQNLLGEYYTPDEDVFLMINGDSFFIDDVKTHYDGTYRFENIPIGRYQVYAYSKDLTPTYYEQDIFPVIKDVEITANYQTITLEDIIINK